MTPILLAPGFWLLTPSKWHKPRSAGPNQPTTATTKPMAPSPSDAVALIMEAKEKKSLTWQQIPTHAGRSPVYSSSACLGENSLRPEGATTLAALLRLSPPLIS